jgi:hypothetical protein
MFYLSRPIRQTLSAEFKEITTSESTAIIQTPSEQLFIADFAKHFPLPWSHYDISRNRSKTLELL